MKKQYTKKQIQEAITYWQKQLFLMEGCCQDLTETSNLDISSKFTEKVKDFIKQGIDPATVSVKAVRHGKTFDITGFMIGWPFKKANAGKTACCIFFSDRNPNDVEPISSLKQLLDEIKEQADEKNIAKISQLVFWSTPADTCTDRQENDSVAKVDDVLINGNVLFFKIPDIKILGKSKIPGEYSDYADLL